MAARLRLQPGQNTAQRPPWDQGEAGRGPSPRSPSGKGAALGTRRSAQKGAAPSRFFPRDMAPCETLRQNLPLIQRGEERGVSAQRDPSSSPRTLRCGDGAPEHQPPPRAVRRSRAALAALQHCRSQRRHRLGTRPRLTSATVEKQAQEWRAAPQTAGNLSREVPAKQLFKPGTRSHGPPLSAATHLAARAAQAPRAPRCPGPPLPTRLLPSSRWARGSAGHSARSRRRRPPYLEHRQAVHHHVVVPGARQEVEAEPPGSDLLRKVI